MIISYKYSIFQFLRKDTAFGTKSLKNQPALTKFETFDFICAGRDFASTYTLVCVTPIAWQCRILNCIKSLRCCIVIAL